MSNNIIFADNRSERYNKNRKFRAKEELNNIQCYNLESFGSMKLRSKYSPKQIIKSEKVWRRAAKLRRLLLWLWSFLN